MCKAIDLTLRVYGPEREEEGITLQEDDVRKCYVGIMEVPARCQPSMEGTGGHRGQTQEEVWEEVSQKPSELEQQRAVLSLTIWWFE